MKAPSFETVEYVVVRMTALILLICAAARLVVHDLVALFK
jgi:hypothetical protein